MIPAQSDPVLRRKSDSWETFIDNAHVDKEYRP